MQGISSKALGAGGNDASCGCPNKKGYNGNEKQEKEFSDGSGFDVYDFNARTYNQQIGRFVQIDPLLEEADQETMSPYHFAFNNPIRFNDPDGRCPLCIPIIVEVVEIAWTAYRTAKAVETVITVVDIINTNKTKTTTTGGNASTIITTTNETEFNPYTGATTVKTESKVKEEKVVSKSDQKLREAALEQKKKEETVKARSENRQNQTKKGNSKQGNSNQTIRGSHAGKGDKQKHTKGDTRRAKDQKVKGPDITY